MSTQHWNPRQYAENARFVSELGMPVVELLAPAPGERVLDLGCGDGTLTVKLASLGCDVVGVDSSPEMVAAAKALGLDARVMRGEALQFVEEFDAVFSNAALHWMSEPAKVVSGVWRALKPGGRFVGEFGGHGNVSTILAALESALARRGISVPSPWYYPRVEDYRGLLEAQGFVVERIALFPRPTPLPGDMRGWLEIFAQSYLSAVPAGELNVFVSEVVDALRATLCDADGVWLADYVRLRFSARKPKSET
jgi:SAM-dependent methyltransferase